MARIGGPTPSLIGFAGRASATALLPLLLLLLVADAAAIDQIFTTSDLMKRNGAPGRSRTDGIYTRTIPDNGSISSSHSQNGILEDNKPSTSAKDAWRTWSLDNSRFSEFQAAEIHPWSRELPKRVDLDTVLMQDNVPGPSNGVAINDHPSDHVDSGRDDIHARLQILELDLTDALKTLRSRLDGVSLDMVILFPAMFSCITLMPMKGDILVGTMEKTLKPGVFLKSGLIENIFLPS